jgi:Uma2 family endonuclease
MASPARLLPGPFTVEMYHRLGELGVFNETDRVELLDGQIVEMTPIGAAHAACVLRLNHLLSRYWTASIAVSMQNPVVLGPKWEPQPDIAVLRRPGGFGGDWLPTARDVVLVIEVADSSLDKDRDLKIPRYAKDGIPEAWLIDLNDDTIVRFRDPGPEGYGQAVTLRRGDKVTPLQLPHIEIAADEVLG